MGDHRVASPILHKGQRRLTLRIGPGQAKGRSPETLEPWELRPNDRSRRAEHEGVATVLSRALCTPTGGSHGRTTEGPAQRLTGAKRRPR